MANFFDRSLFLTLAFLGTSTNAFVVTPNTKTGRRTNEKDWNGLKGPKHSSLLMTTSDQSNGAVPQAIDNSSYDVVVVGL